MTLIGVLMLMVTGPTPMTDGHGFLTKILAGQLIIMGGGPVWPTTAGSGFRAKISIGDRPGFPGEPGVTTSAGLLCLRVALELFTRDRRSALAWTSISISVPTTTTLSMLDLSVSRSCAIEFSHRRKTLLTSTTR